jgi:hypothetical protein
MQPACACLKCEETAGSKPGWNYRSGDLGVEEKIILKYFCRNEVSRHGIVLNGRCPTDIMHILVA